MINHCDNCSDNCAFVFKLKLTIDFTLTSEVSVSLNEAVCNGKLAGKGREKHQDRPCKNSKIKMHIWNRLIGDTDIVPRSLKRRVIFFKKQLNVLKVSSNLSMIVRTSCQWPDHQLRTPPACWQGHHVSPRVCGSDRVLYSHTLLSRLWPTRLVPCVRRLSVFSLPRLVSNLLIDTSSRPS